MGDRANIIFMNVDERVGVYAHWAGRRMAKAAMAVLQNAAFGKRLGDASYATRIGVQTVLETLGSKADEETGFGIFTGDSYDGNYKDIVIDVNDGRVFVGEHEVDDPTESLIADLM